MGKETDEKRSRVADLLEELFRLTAEHGTAIEGMTKEEAITHMRRVREQLWQAKHAHRPGREAPPPGSRTATSLSELEARPFAAAGPRGQPGGSIMAKKTDEKRPRVADLLEELFRLSAEEGTAIDGMTKEQAIAHMRRVRERLWEAKHAYRPGRK